jgi:photosystem II stability/assembly factor-like uncharacterized protein
MERFGHMINGLVLIISMVLFLHSSSAQAQYPETVSHNELELLWSKTYTLEKRISEASAVQARLLNNKGPVVFNDWESMGPNTLDTLSGRVITLHIDPSDSDRLYIGSGSGGLWFSENAGDSWQALTDALPSPHVSAIAVNPLDPQEILIGTGIGQVPTSTLAVGIGVLKSTDGGSTWSTTDFSYPQSAQVSVYELTWDAEEPGTVYLSATNGLYVSSDAGQTWSNLIPNVRIYDFELYPQHHDTMFACVLNQGIRRSTDGGETWENLDNGIPFGSQISRSAITICESQPEIMYASFINSTNFGLIGVYRSADGGDSWLSMDNAPNFPCQPSAPSSCTGWLFHDIAVAPDDPDRILLGSTQYWYSPDGGSSWVWRDYASNGSSGGNEGLTYVDTWKFVFHPSNMGTVYSCNDGGVQRSTDYGHTWERLPQDLVIGQSYSIATSEVDPDFMIGGFHDHGLQRLLAGDNNSTWTRWSLGDGIQTLIDHSNPNVLYGNLQNGTPYKSVNMGSNVQNTVMITNGITESGPWITPLEMDPRFSNVLYTSSNNNLYRSTTGGNSWQSVLNVNTVQNIAVNQLQPDTVYAHAFNATIWSLWRSYDMGANWSEVSASNIPSWGVTCLESSPHDASTIYASRNSINANMDHIKVSYDNGDSWEDITHDLPDIMVRDILVSPLSPDHIYLATELGVFLSVNAGENWQAYNFNLPIIEVYDIDFAAADSTIRIATMGRGIWKTQALGAEAVGIEEMELWAGTAMNLYPNPAREKIWLSLHAPRIGRATLAIIDPLGHEHAAMEVELRAGEQEIEIDLTTYNLSKGAYFFRLNMDKLAIHRPFIIE